MKLDDELLTAYLDGELDAVKMSEVERQLEQSPDLSRQLERLRATDTALKQAYHDIDERPLPDAVLNMLESFPASQEQTATEETGNDTADVIPFRGKSKSVSHTPIWQIAAAASVALVIGLGIGRSLFLPESTAPEQTLILAKPGTGPVEPDSALFAVLENQPSAVPLTIDEQDGTVATPVMSFESIDNRYCREFSITSTSGGTRGVACKGDNQWVVEITVATVGQPAVDAGSYQTASQAIAPVIDNAIQSMIKGEAFGSERETQAIKEHWNRGN